MGFMRRDRLYWGFGYPSVVLKEHVSYDFFHGGAAVWTWSHHPVSKTTSSLEAKPYPRPIALVSTALGCQRST